MNESLEEALKKMNEALEWINDFEAFPDGGQSIPIEEIRNNLEDAIEPLSDLWQATH